MNNFSSKIKDIQALIKAISGKDVDVFITYRTGLGITKPWHIKCDLKEVEHTSNEDAANELYLQLTEELKKRIESAELQVAYYRESFKKIVSQHPS